MLFRHNFSNRMPLLAGQIECLSALLDGSRSPAAWIPSPAGSFFATRLSASACAGVPLRVMVSLAAISRVGAAVGA